MKTEINLLEKGNAYVTSQEVKAAIGIIYMDFATKSSHAILEEMDLE